MDLTGYEESVNTKVIQRQTTLILKANLGIVWTVTPNNAGGLMA